MGDEKPNFSGKYQHIKSENFEDFLRENGELSFWNEIAILPHMAEFVSSAAAICWMQSRCSRLLNHV